jgi:hypothetical protein
MKRIYKNFSGAFSSGFSVSSFTNLGRLLLTVILVLSANAT